MANISTNLLDVILSPTDMGTVTTAIATIDTTIDPVESTLTDEERVSLLSLDVNNKVFAEQALDEAVNNGSMLPTAVNTTFLKNDLMLYDQLDGIESQLENVLRKVRDAKRVAGHEAYAMALTVYTLYRSLAAVGVGMKATESGFTVGVALEDSDATEKPGLIKLRVMVRYERF